MPELIKRTVRFLRQSRKAIIAGGALAAALGLDVSSGIDAIDAAILALIVWLAPNEPQRQRRKQRPELSD